MRYLWLLLLLLLSGCYYYPYYPYYGYWGYPYPPSYPYTYSPASYGTPPSPYAEQGTTTQPQQLEFGNAQPGYDESPALDPNNCGTPDEPKPCSR